MRRPILVIVVLLVACAGFAQTPTQAVSARSAALGGRHVALTDDFFTMFSNPAGFVRETPTFQVSQLTFNLAGPVFDIANMASSGNFSPTDITSLLDKNNRLYTRINIMGPVSVGLVGSGLGVGLFINEHVLVNVPSLTSGCSLTISVETLLVGGYAYRFAPDDHNTIDVGVSAKGFVNNKISSSGDLVALIDAIGNIGGMTGSEVYTASTGIGLDVGSIWTWEKTLAVGLVCRDALTPVITSQYTSFNDFQSNPSGSKIGDSTTMLAPADISVGLLFTPRWTFLEIIDTDLAMMLDYEDALSWFRPGSRNAILNVGMGVELKMLDILSVRAGIKEALPAVGFGLDLALFKLGLAMYGQELGLEPGARPVFNLLLAFDFVY